MCLAAPARVLSIQENVATVDYGGVETTCRLETLTEELAVGDYVLIHTGFAIRRLSPEDGEETLRLFDELSASLRDAEAENPPDADSPVGELSNSQRAASLRDAEAENPPDADSPVGELSDSQRAASLHDADAEDASQSAPETKTS